MSEKLDKYIKALNKTWNILSEEINRTHYYGGDPSRLMELRRTIRKLNDELKEKQYDLKLRKNTQN